ncbi:MAG: MBL fold metallo-hydrolase [Comamonas sp. SCN 65-56]|uniref:quinoprotein relay system zinc metallohydrolase 1 n=1 Tax=Comamonas sp. SCN 65-56 TaxID=1660095 RepID=UPI0008694DDA|nr:quinoprotein relay system zinc metallohydrolase 1 [Comamonas sp. SCN 65-56]ODS93899.1 MAG: MBL fold metallo-hydrolase [Comamonas sp. SCN 65-56]
MKSATLCGLGLLCAAGALAQSVLDMKTLNYDLHPRQIAAGTWVIEGAVADFLPANGCNIINTAFIATGDGVVVINTGTSSLYGEQQRKAIAKVTSEPVRRVLNLNLHPDYFFGNQAWSDVPTQALQGTINGMRAEGGAFADNLYRLCGDWMKGTESTPAREAIEPQTITLGKHQMVLRQLKGHTANDLVVLDKTTGVLFAGGLVFADRVPTTPHADPVAWQESLATLEQWRTAGEFTQLVPSHGPVQRGLDGIAQTQDWLKWVTTTLQTNAANGVDLSELLRQPVPERFAKWAAQPAELDRTLVQWYPRYERAALESPGK